MLFSKMFSNPWSLICGIDESTVIVVISKVLLTCTYILYYNFVYSAVFFYSFSIVLGTFQSSGSR